MVLPGVVRVEAVHRPTESEIRGLADLLDRTTAHDHHRPMGEHALVELKEGPRAFPHAGFVAHAGDELAGYAHLSERETRHGWRLEAFAAPESRGQGVATALLRGVFDHIAGHGGGRIHLWAYHPGDAQRRLADRFDMRLVRRIFRMERALPAPVAPVPPGVRLRPYSPRDAGAWIELHNEAFAGHPDAGDWRPEDLAWHVEEPWFDPSGLILAQDDRGLAGYCWMKLEPEHERGWLYFLGVRPRARRAGLASSLCTGGLAWASGRGAKRGVLYVDEENAAAVRLYEGLGFTVDHEDLCYELDIPASAPSLGDAHAAREVGAG